MVKSIHHINFIVRDLVPAIATWQRVLGLDVTSRDRLDERGVDIARFDLGHSWIVLVQPTRPGSVPAKYLERHGEGFFLLSFGTDSLQAEIDRLGDAKFDGPVREGLDDWIVRDVDVAGTFGAQLQFAEQRDA